MPKIIDAAGLVSGRLTVLHKVDRDKQGYWRWQCECECGAMPVISWKLLGTGVRSCGCLRAELNREKAAAVRKDIVGQTFGWLTVLCYAGPGARANGSRWHCICRCGTEKVVEARSLRQTTISCGCAPHNGTAPRSERARAQSRVLDRRRRAKMKDLKGEFSEEEVTSLSIRQNGRCAAPECRVVLRGRFHRDHIIPVEMQGANDIRNIQLLCVPCNLNKASKHPIDWALERGRLV